MKWRALLERGRGGLGFHQPLPDLFINSNPPLILLILVKCNFKCHSLYFENIIPRQIGSASSSPLLFLSCPSMLLGEDWSESDTFSQTFSANILQGFWDQGPTGRCFQLRDGSGLGIGKNFGFGYLHRIFYQSGIIGYWKSWSGIFRLHLYVGVCNCWDAVLVEH